MKIYTTPTWIYTVNNLDFSDVAAAYVSISGTDCTVHKNTVDHPNQVTIIPADNQVACYLTQAESGRIGYGYSRHQINFILNDGTRVATNIKRGQAGQNLYQEVI